MLVLIARTKFKTTEDREIMASALAVSTVESVREPGMVCYQSSRDPADPLILHAVEIYKTEEDVVHHVNSPHMAVLMEAVSDVESEITITGFEGDLKPLDVDAMLARHSMNGSEKMTFRSA